MAGRWPVTTAHAVLHRRASQFLRRRTARFLGEPTEYVLNQVIDTVLGKDKDLLQWRAVHPGPASRAGWTAHAGLTPAGRRLA